MTLYQVIVFIICLSLFWWEANNNIWEQEIIVPVIKKEVVKKETLSKIYVKTNNVVKKESISKHIIRACRLEKNKNHCIGTTLWFAWWESSMFKNCKKNNCFWMREKVKNKDWSSYYRVIAFKSINHWIDYFIKNYYREYLQNVKTAKDAINIWYCSWECSKEWSDRSKIIEKYVNMFNY